MTQQRHLQCCNGTYTRLERGWFYPWGDPVPGAIDLTLADLMAINYPCDGTDGIGSLRGLTSGERRWLAGDITDSDEVLLRRRHGGGRPNTGDLIVGMLAPELHPATMMAVADIAEAADVTKATIDSYRYRGYLPEPQVVRGRTPLWARPIVARWLATRPGAGWRSDIYDRADRDLAATGDRRT